METFKGVGHLIKAIRNGGRFLTRRRKLKEMGFNSCHSLSGACSRRSQAY